MIQILFFSITSPNSSLGCNKYTWFYTRANLECLDICLCKSLHFSFGFYHVVEVDKEVRSATVKRKNKYLLELRQIMTGHSEHFGRFKKKNLSSGESLGYVNLNPRDSTVICDQEPREYRVLVNHNDTSQLWLPVSSYMRKRANRTSPPRVLYSLLMQNEVDWLHLHEFILHPLHFVAVIW